MRKKRKAVSRVVRGFEKSKMCSWFGGFLGYLGMESIYVLKYV